MRRWLPVALALTLVPAAAELAADEDQTIALGARLRVNAPKAGGLRMGSLLALDSQSLKMQLDDHKDPWTVRRNEITRLAVSTGRGSRGKGALVGAAIGVGVGIVVGFATANSDGFGPTGAAAGAVVAMWLVPIGALAGAASRPAERWRELPIDSVRLDTAAAR